MKFGMFFMGEFVEVVSLAAIASVLFFGGWDVPFLYRDGIRILPPGSSLAATQVPMVHWLVIVTQVVFFLLKIVVFIWFQLMIPLVAAAVSLRPADEALLEGSPAAFADQHSRHGCIHVVGLARRDG